MPRRSSENTHRKTKDERRPPAPVVPGRPRAGRSRAGWLGYAGWQRRRGVGRSYEPRWGLGQLGGSQAEGERQANCFLTPHCREIRVKL